jgi:hypothetical protein
MHDLLVFAAFLVMFICPVLIVSLRGVVVSRAANGSSVRGPGNDKF